MANYKHIGADKTLASRGAPIQSDVQAGASLNFFNLSNPFSKRITLHDGNITNDSGATVIGLVFLNGACTIYTDGRTALTVSNTVSGSGRLTKVDTGVLTLTSASYTGETTVSAGILALVGAALGDWRKCRGWRPTPSHSRALRFMGAPCAKFRFGDSHPGPSALRQNLEDA